MAAYTFFTEDLTFSSVSVKGQRKYFVTGYITTSDRDLVNDIVSDHAITDMMSQLTNKNIKLDVEHEAWKESPNLIPIGRIIESKRDETGIWVKAELNSSHSKFKEVWDSIKGGFLDAFSIAFTTLKATNKLIDGVKTRILDQVELLNVALTGNPANPAAKLLSVITKSMEELPMEEPTPTPVETPVLKAAEAVTETATPVLPDALTVITQELKSLKMAFETYQSTSAAAVEKKDAEIAELKKTLSEPVMKSRLADSPETSESLLKANPALNPLDIL
jgi:HK97 family phage prohead protease